MRITSWALSLPQWRLQVLTGADRDTASRPPRNRAAPRLRELLPCWQVVQQGTPGGTVLPGRGLCGVWRQDEHGPWEATRSWTLSVPTALRSHCRNSCVCLSVCLSSAGNGRVSFPLSPSLGVCGAEGCEGAAEAASRGWLLREPPLREDSSWASKLPAHPLLSSTELSFPFQRPASLPRSWWKRTAPLPLPPAPCAAEPPRWRASG